MLMLMLMQGSGHTVQVVMKVKVAKTKVVKTKVAKRKKSMSC